MRLSGVARSCVFAAVIGGLCSCGGGGGGSSPQAAFAPSATTAPVVGAGEQLVTLGTSSAPLALPAAAGVSAAVVFADASQPVAGTTVDVVAWTELKTIWHPARI